MKENRRRHAFTLIEMLVVILIIGILAGVVFKMMQYANRDALKAETVFVLEAVANALNEFRSEYGTYPPTTNTAALYEMTNRLDSSGYSSTFLPKHPDTVVPLQYGLVSYLWPRPDPPPYSLNARIDDTRRDKAAKKRWEPFLADVPLDRDDDPVYVDLSTQMGNKGGVWLRPEKLKDAWGHEIRYESTPPYLTYRLWSVGINPDDPTDDIHRDRWDN